MIYTFYPVRQDGASMAFDAVDLLGDDVAMEHAQRVLARHLSAAEVVIWAGERRLGVVRRATEPAD